jgi:hypothetical protein
VNPAYPQCAVGQVYRPTASLRNATDGVYKRCLWRGGLNDWCEPANPNFPKEVQCANGLTCVEYAERGGDPVPHGFCRYSQPGSGLSAVIPPTQYTPNGTPTCHNSSSQDTFFNDNNQCNAFGSNLVCRPSAAFASIGTSAASSLIRGCMPPGALGDWCDTSNPNDCDSSKGLRCVGGGGSVNSHGVCGYEDAQLSRLCSDDNQCVNRTDGRTRCRPASPGSLTVNANSCEAPGNYGDTCLTDFGCNNRMICSFGRCR